MYLESSKKLMRDTEKEYKKRLSRTYLHIEVCEKLNKLYVEKGLTINWYGFSTEIVYSLKKTESLSFGANLLLESIDEILCMDDLHFTLNEDYEQIEFKGTYRGKHKVVLTIYYSGSDNCKVKYEDVTVKKAKLICD